MDRSFDSIAVTVLDGVGCGEAQDCQETYPEDRGANSLAHASLLHPIDAPTLQWMGLEHIPGLENLSTRDTVPLAYIRSAYGAMEPTFAGKGSPEGHQALMGYEIQNPYLYFDKAGFPPDLISAIEREVSLLLGRPVEVIRYPGTDDVSGTVFIEHPSIGPAHLASLTMTRLSPLKLPVYASSDSVVQIAIHQEVLPQDVIEKIGHTVRTQVCDAFGYRVGRVIMRPFVGTPGNFKRVSADRRDYAVDPDEPTLVDHLTKAGVPVFGIGKAPDMLNHRGFPEGSTKKFDDDAERVEAIEVWMRGKKKPGFLFANLNETDELFGHRRNPTGYIKHINAIDTSLGHITDAMTDHDLLIVTSDHGNDPTHTRHTNHVKSLRDHVARPHTNHTRERVPLLVYHHGMHGPIALGIRQTYADIAATIAENFGIEEKFGKGRSFLNEITR